MKTNAETVHISGPAGPIETIIENPGNPVGIALVCHPHPLFGGSNTNKVTQTVARALVRLNYVALRPNFRGVGQSAGSHDDGRGECDDMLAVLADARHRFGDLPVALGGFSFGAYVQTHVAKGLADEGRAVERMVLVGTAAGDVKGIRRYTTGTVGEDTIVIHGGADETVPLANVLAWAEPFDLPVIVIPGADHFFHRRLHIINDIVTRAWRP
ncbi:alpha/beta hydrolase [Propionivibrio soli]|uniref:alpha/beta hydrolase n=1 Tax=Propionivibrio soli TaxID=2976531 RepID=UPI0021E77792|nr:alpha/beta hydrolase [Propionivibrio soli]